MLNQSPPVRRLRLCAAYRAPGHAAVLFGRLTLVAVWSWWFLRRENGWAAFSRAGGTWVLRLGPVLAVWQGRGE